MEGRAGAKLRCLLVVQLCSCGRRTVRQVAPGESNKGVRFFVTRHGELP